MFVWGAGNFGQFGMGTAFLGDYDKPTRNKLVEEKITQGTFGGEGAGIESVASGGLHTLFVDEAGKVSFLYFLVPSWLLNFLFVLDLVLRRQRQCRSWTSH
jgi:hypothetical protein